MIEFMIDNFTKEELMNEKWKSVDGYDGLYEVSDLGRVRSRKSGEWKVMRPVNNGTGYLLVSLYRNGKQKQSYIHRLVAQAFIPNDDESKSQINHRDECKQNNRIWNLEYCTAKYNVNYNGLRYKQPHPQHVRNKIKDLYDQNLSIKQNIELFMANGIECSRNTIWKLRKDLNLKHRSNYKRNKLKDIYRIDLSIDDNIKLFKSKGIECSRETVLKLRKDLGLTKHYRPRKKTN